MCDKEHDSYSKKLVFNELNQIMTRAVSDENKYLYRSM